MSKLGLAAWSVQYETRIPVYSLGHLLRRLFRR